MKKTTNWLNKQIDKNCENISDASLEQNSTVNAHFTHCMPTDETNGQNIEENAEKEYKRSLDFVNQYDHIFLFYNFNTI